VIELKRIPGKDIQWEVWQGSAQLGAFWWGGQSGWIAIIGPSPKIGTPVPKGIIDTNAIANWIRAQYLTGKKGAT